MSTSNIQIFDFDGRSVRVVVINGDPWWVGSDVAKALGYRDGPTVVRMLRDRDKGSHSVCTPGGMQSTTVVSESGLYRLIMKSRRPDAESFQDWVTDEVIPSIRKTGSYSATPAAIPSHSEALRGWASEIDARELAEAKSAELEATAKITGPKADAWDDLASADGDCSVGDAAKILQRGGVKIGRTRLFRAMVELNMVYVSGSARAYVYHPYQTQVDAGRLVKRLGGVYQHPKTGETTAGAATVRVTAKGVAYLRVRLSPTDRNALAPARVDRA